MKRIKGYLYAIIAAIGFGSAPLLGAHILQEGVGPLMLAFWRVLLLVPVFFAVVVVKKESFRLAFKPFLIILFLALTGGVLTTALLFQSWEHIDTGTATTLNFTYPVFVLVLGIVLYRERLTKSVALSFILCVLGILMFCDPGGHFTWRGFFMALGSGLTYGVYMLYLDKSDILMKVSFDSYTFYFFLLSSSLFLPITLLTHQMSAPASPTGWAFLAAFTLVGGVFATVLLQKGIQEIGSRETSILASLEPVTSAVLGTLFLGEKITILRTLGILLVLASTTVLVMTSRHGEEQK